MTARSLCAQVTLSFLTRLQRRTGAKNVCLVGGVAQNSVLHGRLEPSPQANPSPNSGPDPDLTPALIPTLPLTTDPDH